MNNMPQRLVFFALGVVINSFGVALITLGNLGTSAISSVPYVCSLQFPMFSFGVTTFIWNILLILLQVVLLRRDFKPSQFLQIMVNVLFSAMIDVSMAILGVLYPTMLQQRASPLRPPIGVQLSQRESPWQRDTLCVDCQGLPLWERFSPVRGEMSP